MRCVREQHVLIGRLVRRLLHGQLNAGFRSWLTHVGSRRREEADGEVRRLRLGGVLRRWELRRVVAGFNRWRGEVFAGERGRAKLSLKAMSCHL